MIIVFPFVHAFTDFCLFPLNSLPQTRQCVWRVPRIAVQWLRLQGVWSERRVRAAWCRHRRQSAGGKSSCTWLRDVQVWPMMNSVQFAWIIYCNVTLSRTSLSLCRFGWIDEQVAIIPRIQAKESCGQGRVGIITWRASLTTPFDVFCFNLTGSTWHTLVLNGGCKSIGTPCLWTLYCKFVLGVLVASQIFIYYKYAR